MRCSRLIIIYGVFFAFSLMIILSEKNIYRNLKKEVTIKNEVFSRALDAAADVLKNSIYEDDAAVLVSETFAHVLTISMGLGSESIEENRERILRIGYYVNDKEVVSLTELKHVKSGDSVGLYIELKEEIISVPGRKVSFQNCGTRSITLD